MWEPDVEAVAGLCSPAAGSPTQSSGSSSWPAIASKVSVLVTRPTTSSPSSRTAMSTVTDSLLGHRRNALSAARLSDVDPLTVGQVAVERGG